jgi:hypothetical protein
MVTGLGYAISFKIICYDDLKRIIILGTKNIIIIYFMIKMYNFTKCITFTNHDIPFDNDVEFKIQNSSRRFLLTSTLWWAAPD